MGMFDSPSSLTKSDLAGGEFVAWSGEYLGKSQHGEYGENDRAALTCSPVNDPHERREYTVFGVMADQVRRIRPGDLPAVVRINKDGRANVLQLIRKLDDEPTTF